MSDEKHSAAATQPFTPIDQHLFESRTIFLSGQVDEEQAEKVNRQLLAMERASASAPIVLWIDSPGGEVYSGFGIYDAARFVKPRVITLVAGRAWSMGSVIALAAEKQDRVALPNAKFLIHQPLIGGVMRGSVTELEIHTRDMAQLKGKLHKLYSERTGTPVDRFVELMERDRWLEAKEALELGLISKIVSSRADLESLLAR